MNFLDKYDYQPSQERIDSLIQKISEVLPDLGSAEVLKKCFAFMDLTTLKTNDTPESVLALVNKANAVLTEFEGYPLPASICVYPNFASIVRDNRVSPELHVTCTAACFPSSQSFIEVKELECKMAVEAGADEIDIVLALNAFLSQDYIKAFDEIVAIRRAIDKAAAGRKIVLKVILETGLLVSPEKIAQASLLAMEAGADFIKTSTGKVDVNATPAAAVVMCECIKAYYQKTGRMVGFKPAGGISTSGDALSYYYIVSSILGEKWLNKEYFRLGVSRLGNSLVSAIEQKTVKFF